MRADVTIKKRITGDDGSKVEVEKETPVGRNRRAGRKGTGLAAKGISIGRCPAGSRNGPQDGSGPRGLAGMCLRDNQNYK
jgi:hypothetical protein